MYTEKDCEPCDGSQCLIDRVVVLRQEEKSGQIFLCLGGEGSGILAERGALRLICLENGERHIGWRENMLGILRPELLGKRKGCICHRFVRVEESRRGMGGTGGIAF